MNACISRLDTLIARHPLPWTVPDGDDIRVLDANGAEVDSLDWTPEEERGIARLLCEAINA